MQDQRKTFRRNSYELSLHVKLGANKEEYSMVSISGIIRLPIPESFSTILRLMWP